jgi:hypothetical protein
MSTRCLIGKDQGDGTSKVIYVHFDGYVRDGVGDTLIHHYQDETNINEMIESGDRSSLVSLPKEGKLYKEGPRIESNKDWGYCGQEFEYFWTDGKWYWRESYRDYSDNGKVSNLSWNLLTK